MRMKIGNKSGSQFLKQNIIFDLLELLVRKYYRKYNYQTITAEGMASLRKEGMLCNASFEKPVQVLKHEGENST